MQTPVPLFLQQWNEKYRLKTFSETKRLSLPFSIWNITGGLHTSQMDFWQDTAKVNRQKIRNSLFSWNWRGIGGQEERSQKLEYSQDTKGRPLQLAKKCYWRFNEYKQEHPVAPPPPPPPFLFLLFSPCLPAQLSVELHSQGKSKSVILWTAVPCFLKHTGACRITLVHPLWEQTGPKCEAGWGMNTNKVFLMSPFQKLQMSKTWRSMQFPPGTTYLWKCNVFLSGRWCPWVQWKKTHLRNTGLWCKENCGNPIKKCHCIMLCS